MTRSTTTGTKQQPRHVGGQAIVLGASMAGLCAARILSDRFDPCGRPRPRHLARRPTAASPRAARTPSPPAARRRRPTARAMVPRTHRRARPGRRNRARPLPRLPLASRRRRAETTVVEPALPCHVSTTARMDRSSPSGAAFPTSTSTTRPSSKGCSAPRHPMGDRRPHRRHRTAGGARRRRHRPRSPHRRLGAAPRPSPPRVTVVTVDTRYVSRTFYRVRSPHPRLERRRRDR